MASPRARRGKAYANRRSSARCESEAKLAKSEPDRHPKAGRIDNDHTSGLFSLDPSIGSLDFEYKRAIMQRSDKLAWGTIDSCPSRFQALPLVLEFHH
jgi:hypothetical protein